LIRIGDHHENRFLDLGGNMLGKSSGRRHACQAESEWNGVEVLLPGEKKVARGSDVQIRKEIMVHVMAGLPWTCARGAAVSPLERKAARLGDAKSAKKGT